MPGQEQAPGGPRIVASQNQMDVIAIAASSSPLPCRRASAAAQDSANS